MEKFFQLARPLHHQVNGGSQHNGGTVDCRNAPDRKIGLSGTGGHDHRSTGMCRPPALHGTFLMFHGFIRVMNGKRKRFIIPCTILQIHPQFMGGAENGGVIHGRCPVDTFPHAFILPEKSLQTFRQGKSIRCRTLILPEKQRPGGKFQKVFTHDSAKGIS